MKYTILVIIASFLFSGCTLSDKKIEEHYWKAGNSVVGDVLFFNNYNFIKKDTIYKNNQPIAVINERNFRWYADNIIVVKSIENNKEGEYYQKE